MNLTRFRGIAAAALLALAACSAQPAEHRVGTDIKPAPGGTGGSGISQLTGPVTAGPGSGSQASTIAANAVTLANMAALADQRVIGNVSGDAGTPAALTATQVQTMLSVQPSTAVAITGGTISGTTVTGYVPTTTTLTGTAPLTVAGDNAAHDLSANRTIAIVAATSSVAGSMSAADKALVPVDFVTTLGSPAASITVSGLAGDTDGDYDIDLILLTTSAGACTFQPNGTGSNQKSDLTYWNGTVTTGAAFASSLSVVNGASTGTIAAHIYFTSKTGRIRLFQESITDYTDVLFGTVVGAWNDTATAITSLVIGCSGGGSSLGTGSYMRVRALHKPN